MDTPPAGSRSLARWLGAALLAAVTWGAWLLMSEQPPTVAPVRSPAETPAAAKRPDEPATVAAPRDADRATASTPRGLSAEQWTELQASLRDHPDREAEIARVSGFLSWQLDLQTFRELRRQGNSAQADAIARSLLQTLPERVARYEIGMEAAAQLQESLMETAVPDATARQALRESLQATRPTLTAAQKAQGERDARFQAGQEAAVAAWQARPDEADGTQALEDAIEALRESIYGDASTGARR